MPPAHTGRNPTHEQPEGGWPQVRARLVAEKIVERRNRAASPRLYMDGSVPVAIPSHLPARVKVCTY
jgi:hypothetical protein